MALIRRRRHQQLTVLLLVLVAGVLALAALALGPVGIHPDRLLAAVLGRGSTTEIAILWVIRLPRLLLGVAAGTALALSGAALQGVLRNPLADPGLIGITAGASLGSVTVIVLGGVIAESFPTILRPWLLPVAAFLGAALVIVFVFSFARRSGRTSVATLILAGVAVNATAAAVIGALVYISDDDQLRDLTFWTMGALAGANWPLVLVVTGLTAVSTPLLMGQARALDLLQLGERSAFHSGLDVEHCKRRVALATAVSVGAVTSAAGPIGFIGLVAPHLARLVLGPRHAVLLPVAVLMGVGLVLAADLAVRLVTPPAEPPLGLATSLLGGPFFLWLLLRKESSDQGGD
ncbi:MAG: hypothetical protein TQ37_03815 [Candidatus Synechococcus spongiarum 15L]|uniref:Iron ABC transporter n=1 Tax=Candidatus Synechococcus spongiarum 15L TaxID=1608419 RepID=A0A0G8AWG8_9SYNE|nr:MAG: hypothetical protein TQ37_03815 [Candidatus Synechococcus spongiarum 15L]